MSASSVGASSSLIGKRWRKLREVALGVIGGLLLADFGDDCGTSRGNDDWTSFEIAHSEGRDSLRDRGGTGY